MVGGLMLLKMLHCRRVRRRNKKLRRSPSDEVTHHKSGNVIVKVEALEDETQTCRVCLKEGVIPIYSSIENGEEIDLSEPLRSFGGIHIYADDEYPKHLCQSCHDLLQGAILLRKTAQQSEERLRYQCEMETEVNNYSDSDNDNDNHCTQNNDHTGDLDTSTEYRSEIISKQEVYRCKPCDLEFESFNDYSNHRLSAEHENKRHTCSICNKTYTSLYYKRHMALHKHEKTYMCDVCGKEFIAQNPFNRHRLTHFYDLPFQCSLCPYKGRFTESLKMHMRSHTGEKPYQCTACPSKFVNKSNLNKHMFTHNGNHNFKCEDCGRGFYTKRALELHFKVDHTGIKDHVCNVCGKAFGYRKQMMKHQLKVHKREKLRSGRLPLYLQVKAQEAKEHED